MTYKVLLVGECSREHAIADAIARSTHKVKLYAVMKHVNPGIKRLCKTSGGDVILGDFLDPKFVAEKAREVCADVVVVGPEEPLFRGVCDEVERVGISCIGPCRAAAQIEQSKAFMRELMWKYRIPGRLRFYTFRSISEALSFLSSFGESVAIKPARQVGGKGVKVLADLQAYLSDVKRDVRIEHAKDVVENIMRGYDDVDVKLLVEEKVEGPEYTLQCFTDGANVLPMPLVQDYKHAFEFGIGPETGGMGSIADKDYTLPFITREEFERSVEIVRQIVHAIKKELGVEYKGIISGQMMLTTIWGPTVIECYARFGDPEAVNVLSVMETDFMDIVEAVLSKSLPKIKLKFKPYATVTKAVAPEGYPLNKRIAQGHPIEVDVKRIEERGCRVFFGSVHEEDGKLITVGSRAVEIVGFGETIPEAAERVNSVLRCVRALDGWRMFYRLDIGTRESLQEMIDLASLVRSVYTYRMSAGLLGKIIDWMPGKGVIIHEY